MNCPKCKTKTKVTDSATDGKYVYRRRLCPECGFRFFSLEAADERARYYLWQLRGGIRQKEQRRAQKAKRKGRRR